MTKPTCFVIQPFDEGNDKRFEDTIKPAIEEAGLDAYRVDQDPTTQVLIKAIEEHIRDSRICLADITTDNPNVWYEVGFALASRKQVVFICENRRERFPFDIQHRKVVRYGSSSKTDFHELGRAITQSCEALLTEPLAEAIDRSETKPSNVGPLTDTDKVVLSAIAEGVTLGEWIAVESIFDGIGAPRLRRSDRNTSLLALTERKYVVIETHSDNWRSEYSVVRITDGGWSWLRQNPQEHWNQPEQVETAASDEDDPVPF